MTAWPPNPGEVAGPGTAPFRVAPPSRSDRSCHGAGLARDQHLRSQSSEGRPPAIKPEGHRSRKSRTRTHTRQAAAPSGCALVVVPLGKRPAATPDLPAVPLDGPNGSTAPRADAEVQRVGSNEVQVAGPPPVGGEAVNHRRRENPHPASLPPSGDLDMPIQCTSSSTIAWLRDGRAQQASPEVSPDLGPIRVARRSRPS